MSTTVNVICYNSKVLKNNEHPLMLRVCKDRKRKYLSLGISVKAEHWDFKKNKPKSNCPNKELILRAILDKEAEFQKQILEYKSEQKEFTASTLLNCKTEKFVYKTVSGFYIEHIQYLKSIDKIGNAKAYQDSFNSLNRFTHNKLDFYFNEITVEWLNTYERWLRDNGCKDTSMSVFFRTLRSIYNKAVNGKLQMLLKRCLIAVSAVFTTNKKRFSTVNRSIEQRHLIFCIKPHNPKGQRV